MDLTTYNNSTLKPQITNTYQTKLKRAKLRYITFGTHFKIKIPVHLLNSEFAIFFSVYFASFLLFFPCFRLWLTTRKPQNYFLLFLYLIPSLLLKLDEIEKPSSLNSLSHSIFPDWLAGTNKIRWYVLAESHYMFSILVARFCVILRFGRVFLCWLWFGYQFLLLGLCYYCFGLCWFGFSILAARFVLFWGLVEFSFAISNKGFNFG